MTNRNVLVAVCLTASLAFVIQAEQAPASAPAGTQGQGAPGAGRQGGGRAGGAATGAANRAPIGGTLTPATPDGRGWGCPM